MSLGNYPDRIRVEQRVVSGKAGNGEDLFAWALVRPLWAKYEPLNGRELMAAQQQQAETIARFRMYYRTDIEAEMRITFGGKRYDIESVIDVGGRREELELMCKTGLTDG